MEEKTQQIVKIDNATMDLIKQMEPFTNGENEVPIYSTRISSDASILYRLTFTSKFPIHVSEVWELEDGIELEFEDGVNLYSQERISKCTSNSKL